MKEVRYYLRDRNKHPRVTVVLLWEPGLDTYYRGISICSWLDPVVKKVGYHKAKERSLQAKEVAEFTTGHLRSQPICSFNAREIVEFECFGIELIPFGKSAKLKFLELTKFEQKLVAKSYPQQPTCQTLAV